MSKKIFKGIGKVAKVAVGGIIGSSLIGKKKKPAAATTTPAADGKGPVVTPLAANDPRLAAARGASGGGLGSPTILSSDYMGSLLQRSNRLGS